MRAYRKTALMWRREARVNMRLAELSQGGIRLHWVADVLTIIRDHSPIQVRAEEPKRVSIPTFSEFFCERDCSWPEAADLGDWVGQLGKSFAAVRDYLDIYGPGDISAEDAEAIRASAPRACNRLSAIGTDRN